MPHAIKKILCFFHLHSYFLAGTHLKYSKKDVFCFHQYFHCKNCENYKRKKINKYL